MTMKFFIGINSNSTMFITDAIDEETIIAIYGKNVRYKEISFSQYKKHIEEFEGELKIKMEIKNV